jgi:hypothetical protein
MAERNYVTPDWTNHQPSYHHARAATSEAQVPSRDFHSSVKSKPMHIFCQPEAHQQPSMCCQAIQSAQFLSTVDCESKQSNSATPGHIVHSTRSINSSLGKSSRTTITQTIQNILYSIRSFPGYVPAAPPAAQLYTVMSTHKMGSAARCNVVIRCANTAVAATAPAATTALQACEAPAVTWATGAKISMQARRNLQAGVLGERCLLLGCASSTCHSVLDADSGWSCPLLVLGCASASCHSILNADPG